MPTVNLGKVGMTLKGVYDNEAQYEKLDVVYYDDSTYCAKVNTQGNLPTDETYWQLLVAPNPLATWKPNTKEDEGYVQKGEGHEDSLWATDSDGNPAWVKKSDVATKVGTNTRTEDGIVLKGQNNPYKVWGTDKNSNPSWQDPYSPLIILDTAGWPSSYYSYSRIIAKITFYVTLRDLNMEMQSVSFSNFSESGDFPQQRSRVVFGINVGTNVNPEILQYDTGGMYSRNYGILYKPQRESNYIDIYLCTKYCGTSKIDIFDLDKTAGVNNIEWLWDLNKYVDLTRLSESGYEYNGYSYLNGAAGFYDMPTNGINRYGAVPKTNGKQYAIYGTDSSGEPKWLTADNWGFQTSAQVQEAISTAIASADFSSFEIVEAQPTPETAVENKFYLVKNEASGHYDIYAKIGENVEWIDDTTVDLSNYTTLTDEQYNALIQLLGEE